MNPGMPCNIIDFLLDFCSGGCEFDFYPTFRLRKNFGAGQNSQNKNQKVEFQKNKELLEFHLMDQVPISGIPIGWYNLEFQKLKT